MPQVAAPPLPATTFARLVWPAKPGLAVTMARAGCLAAAGACLLTIAAKVQVPGPVPMTLQTLAVLALGAALGARLALASVGLYLLEGALGLPVFANTPPLVPGMAYFLGPTGGFLFGFALAAGLVGTAADRGGMRNPLAFALALLAAEAALLGAGWLWLAFVAQTAAGGAGIGLAKAFALGVRPFLLGEAIKLGIAVLAIPLLYETVARRFGPQP